MWGIMDIICINSSFSQEQLQFWAIHGVVHPEQDKMYTIREVIKHSHGETGVLLEEIVNPKIPVKHNILKIIQREPTWNIHRFRMLNGDMINKETVSEFQKLTKT